MLFFKAATGSSGLAFVSSAQLPATRFLFSFHLEAARPCHGGQRGQASLLWQPLSSSRSPRRCLAERLLCQWRHAFAVEPEGLALELQPANGNLMGASVVLAAEPGGVDEVHESWGTMSRSADSAMSAAEDDLLLVEAGEPSLVAPAPADGKLSHSVLAALPGGSGGR